MLGGERITGADSESVANHHRGSVANADHVADRDTHANRNADIDTDAVTNADCATYSNANGDSGLRSGPVGGHRARDHLRPAYLRSRNGRRGGLLHAL
jgi:hypothetical protein